MNKMLMNKTVLPLAVLVAVLLAAAALAIFQAVRVVQPAEVLPALAAIEGTAAQLNAQNGAIPALRQARAAVELAIAEPAVKGPTQGGVSAQLLKNAAASLAIAENESTQQATRLAALGAELNGRVKLIREQVGPPAMLDRLAGLTVKELLIAFAWPLFAMIAVLYFLGSVKGGAQLNHFIRQFRSVKLPGLELVVGEELKQTAEQAFQFHREQTKKQFDLWAQRQKLSETVNRILEVEVEPFLRSTIKNVPDYRCTIHVPDLLFADSLYQLIDYLPKGGGPRGRAWSVRYGMVGKQWRLGKGASSGDVAPNTDELIREWGMTRDEARGAGRRKSLVCAVLQHATRGPVGILYLDAAAANAFGSQEQSDELLKTAEEACKKYRLIDTLSALQDELRRQAPLIRIYG